jgi:hypothetical protein
MAADDALGAFGQRHGRLLVVGAVTHVLTQDAFRFVCIGVGGGDRGQVLSVASFDDGGVSVGEDVLS